MKKSEKKLIVIKDTAKTLREMLQEQRKLNKKKMRKEEKDTICIQSR